jgi:dihydroflavonol-4-reductase
MELSVVNPVMVFGPVLGADYSTSIAILGRMMEGKLPGLPRISFGAVDVRDVADLHLKAMTNPAAKAERFLAVAGPFVSMREVAEILKRRMGDAGRRVPTRELPDWLLKVVGRFNRSVGQMVPELGKRKNGSNEKAKRLLGWEPRSTEEAVVAAAESLVRLGLVKQTCFEADSGCRPCPEALRQ